MRADLDNIRKRLSQNAEQQIEQAKDQILLDMLPFAENLERILENESNREECAALHEGIALTL